MYATLLLVLLLPMGGAQTTDPEAAYRADYAQFTDISSVADLADRAKQFMDFQEKGFDDRLAEYVAGGIQTALVGLAEAGEADALYPLADRWDAGTGDYTGAAISLQAAAAAQDSEMIVKYGEIVYSQQPVIDIAEVLAGNYSALGNEDKYLHYAAIVIEAKGLADSFDFAYDMYLREMDESDWDEAADWAARLKALPSAPAGKSAREWADMSLEFQTTIARAAFEAERWDAATREYQTLQSMNRNRRGMANFYLGQINLETQNFNTAMQRFADASVVNDATYSTPARAMLEEIYKTNTGGTLEGLDDNVLNAARARMR